MSTTTSNAQKPELEEGAVTETAGRSLQGWLLILLVLVAGAASLGIEMSASRLLAPYFGTSQFVWANLIGLILLYLTLGYYIGGRLADRYPRPAVLYLLTACAAFMTGLVPLISRPILTLALNAFVSYSVSEFYGSLVSVILLFAIPMILLGCVSPFAIRLRIQQVGRSGHIAGQLYAISTAGSMIGTFLPVLWLIPSYGTARTFFIIAISLLLVSIVGLLTAGFAPVTPGEPEKKEQKSRKSGLRLLSLLLLLPLLAELLTYGGPIKPAQNGVLIAEQESAYNYIQVVRVGDEVQLVLNEGQAVHSVYNPHSILSNGPWDYFMIAPFFNNPPYRPDMLHSAAIIGLGAGTIARELTAAYGSIPIDGVEIDGTIVQLGRQYFGMREPNLHTIVQDGRYFMRTTPKKYDLIGIDAYQQPYVPFQLTTAEFFSEVRAHLTPTGVAVINAGHTSTDFRLVETLAQTMHSVFPNVYIVNASHYENSLVIGTNAETTLDNFFTNTQSLHNPLLRDVTDASIVYGNIRAENGRHVYFSDDRAPVEELIDQMILNAISSGNE